MALLLKCLGTPDLDSTICLVTVVQMPFIGRHIFKLKELKTVQFCLLFLKLKIERVNGEFSTGSALETGSDNSEPRTLRRHLEEFKSTFSWNHNLQCVLSLSGSLLKVYATSHSGSRIFVTQ